VSLPYLLYQVGFISILFNLVLGVLLFFHIGSNFKTHMSNEQDFFMKIKILNLTGIDTLFFFITTATNISSYFFLPWGHTILPRLSLPFLCTIEWAFVTNFCSSIHEQILKLHISLLPQQQGTYVPKTFPLINIRKHFAVDWSWVPCPNLLSFPVAGDLPDGITTLDLLFLLQFCMSVAGVFHLIFGVSRLQAGSYYTFRFSFVMCYLLVSIARISVGGSHGDSSLLCINYCHNDGLDFPHMIQHHMTIGTFLAFI
ncbi:hypothetical protein ACJX0J_027415, partial [Zea mays]